MYNNASSPTLSDVTFSGNSVDMYGIGAGMFNANNSTGGCIMRIATQH